MTKKKVIISGIILTPLLLLVLTGGLLVYTGPQYRFDREHGTIEEGEGFIPNSFHLGYNVSDVPLIPILLHRIHSELPKQLIINKYDITYLKTHDGYTHFRIDELLIMYENGKTAVLVNSEQPEASRTFKISESWFDQVVFENAIDQKSGFKYQIKGVSFSEEGSSFPFKYVQKYKCVDDFRVGTRYGKWASV